MTAKNSALAGSLALVALVGYAVTQARRKTAGAECLDAKCMQDALDTFEGEGGRVIA